MGREGPGNSAAAEPLLRAVALWAADCVEQALPIFTKDQPGDDRVAAALAGALAFGAGGERDKALRSLAWGAHAAAQTTNSVAAQYAARAAMLAAAVAYTHTDLTEGKQGINQARHLLGPAVYAALACELAKSEAGLGEELVRQAADAAPEALHQLLRHFPPQPPSKTPLGQLFHNLDARLRQSWSD